MCCRVVDTVEVTRSTLVLFEIVQLHSLSRSESLADHGENTVNGQLLLMFLGSGSKKSNC